MRIFGIYLEERRCVEIVNDAAAWSANERISQIVVACYNVVFMFLFRLCCHLFDFVARSIIVEIMR